MCSENKDADQQLLHICRLNAFSCEGSNEMNVSEKIRDAAN